MKRCVFVIAIHAVIVLSGCGQSAQEKVAQEQLKAIEQQKELVRGFQDAAVKANADAGAKANEKANIIDWNATLKKGK